MASPSRNGQTPLDQAVPTALGRPDARFALEGPASDQYLGYDLDSFGFYGLLWFQGCQAEDEVFRHQQAIHDAELVLSHPIQKLDHTYDHHFPTNVERFGLNRLSLGQRIKEEPKNRGSLGLCSRSSRNEGCLSCQSCIPSFVHTHPSLICDNDTDGPTLLYRFRNENHEEVRIMRCLTCESYRKTGCSFNNGDVRLRRSPDGSVKIVYQLAGQDAIVVRDISETNVGIRDQRSSSDLGPDSHMQATLQGRGVKRVVSNTSLKESEEKAPREAGINGTDRLKVESSDEDQTGSGYEEEEEDEEEEDYGGEMIDDNHAPWNNYKFTSDPEDEDFSDKRKKKRSSRSRNNGDSRQPKSSRINDRASVRNRTQGFPQLPTPATSTSPVFPEMRSRNSANNDQQGRPCMNHQNGVTSDSSSEDDTLAERQASRIRSKGALNQTNQANPTSTKGGAISLTEIQAEYQEAEKKHLLLRRIEQLKDSINALEQAHNSAGDKGGRTSKDLEATIHALEREEELRKRTGQLLAVNEELEKKLF